LARSCRAATLEPRRELGAGIAASAERNSLRSLRPSVRPRFRRIEREFTQKISKVSKGRSGCLARSCCVATLGPNRNPGAGYPRVTNETFVIFAAFCAKSPFRRIEREFTQKISKVSKGGSGCLARSCGVATLGANRNPGAGYPRVTNETLCDLCGLPCQFPFGGSRGINS
jgi:hypothetical protein